MAALALLVALAALAVAGVALAATTAHQRAHGSLFVSFPPV